MATPSITRQIPIRVPGNLGDHQGYGSLPDAAGYLNFRNGETLSIAPTFAEQSSKLFNKNIRVMLNEGRMTPDNIPKQFRTMFAKNGCISDVNPGKPFNEFSDDECARVVSQLYAGKGGFGFITGEAQENESAWKFQTQYAPNQVRKVYQGITDYANANPSLGIINGGLIYATCSTIWWGKTAGSITADYQTVRNAFSSVGGARALLAAFEWEFNRYYGLELFKTGAIPLVNAYDVHNDDWLLYWKVVLVMELVAKANEGAFADPFTMSVFFWARAKELQPYSELYPVDLGNGLTMYMIEWPSSNPNCVYAMAKYAFERGKHVQQWDNPYLFSDNVNNIPESGDRIFYNGNTGGRNVTSKFNPAPYVDNTAYSYATAPFGYNDLIPIAGKMHCIQGDFLNKRTAPVQWYVDGVAGPAPDAGYIPYCIDNRKPHVRAAVEGNRAVINIFQPTGEGGHVTVDLGGSFGRVTVDYWPNCDNQLHLQL